MLVMALGKEPSGIRGRIDAARQTRDVEGIREGAHLDAVARPVLNRLDAGLEVDEGGFVGWQALEERGFSHTAWAEDRHGGFGARLAEALIRGDNAKRHQRSPLCSKRYVG